MPQLAWNETEFCEFTGVEPRIEDYGVSHHFELERSGLQLQLTIWQLESVIQVSLTRLSSDPPLVEFVAYVRGEARCIDDKRGRYIALEDCVIAPSRFWHQQAGDVFDRGKFPPSLTVMIALNPDINIAIKNYLSRT